MNVLNSGIFWPPVGDSVIPGYGNPPPSLTVKFYLTAVKEEQLLARTVPIQVEPFFIQGLAATSSEILKRLSGRISSPTQLFILARDHFAWRLAWLEKRMRDFMGCGWGWLRSDHGSCRLEDVLLSSPLYKIKSSSASMWCKRHSSWNFIGLYGTVLGFTQAFFIAYCFFCRIK